MGKRAREESRLKAMEAMAQNLEGLGNAKYIVAGIECSPVELLTQYGPTVGVGVGLLMADGSQREPIVFDPRSALAMIAGLSGALTGPTPPVVARDQEPDEADDTQLALFDASDHGPAKHEATPVPETTTESGIILPGGK